MSDLVSAASAGSGRGSSDGPRWPACVLDRRGDAVAQVDDRLLLRSGLRAARSDEAVAAHEQEQQHGGGDAARRLAHVPTEGDDRQHVHHRVGRGGGEDRARPVDDDRGEGGEGDERQHVGRAVHLVPVPGEEHEPDARDDQPDHPGRPARHVEDEQDARHHRRHGEPVDDLLVERGEDDGQRVEQVPLAVEEDHREADPGARR